MKKTYAELLLLTALLLRSSSFVFNKMGIDQISPFTLLALRFLLAFFPLALIFHKKLKALNKQTLLHGMILGIVCFFMMATELVSLKTISASTACFLESIAIVLIPLCTVFTTKKLPHWSAPFCAVIALAGIGFLTLDGGAISFAQGEWFALIAAALMTLLILLTDRFAKSDDPVALGVLQNGFTGLFALPFALTIEEAALPSSPQLWLVVAALVILCTVLGFTLQPVAQRYTDPERVGLLCAVPPMFIMLLDALFMGQSLTLSGWIGAGLIVGSIFLSNILQKCSLISPHDKRAQKEITVS